MIYDRILKFLKNHIQEVPEGIWQGIMNVHHKSIIDAVTRGDAQALQQALANPQIIWGIEAPNRFPFDSGGDGLEILNRLGRRLGHVCVYNPEQVCNNTVNSDWANLQTAIESDYGQLWIPEVFGRPSRQDLDTGYMFLQHLAHCATLKMFLPGFPQSIMEIGAGYGLMAYGAKRFGTKNYTIIDVPTTCAISIHFLANALGEEQVWIWGEPENESAFAKVYPASQRESAFNLDCDLIFNSNSFPEIPCEEQDRYIQSIGRKVASGALFYSSNHESNMGGQRSVRQAMAANLVKMKCLYRAPFMCREGYVEEIWTKQD